MIAVPLPTKAVDVARFSVGIERLSCENRRNLQS